MPLLLEQFGQSKASLLQPPFVHPRQCTSSRHAQACGPQLCLCCHQPSSSGASKPSRPALRVAFPSAKTSASVEKLGIVTGCQFCLRALFLPRSHEGPANKTHGCHGARVVVMLLRLAIVELAPGQATDDESCAQDWRGGDDEGQHRRRVYRGRVPAPASVS